MRWPCSSPLLAVTDPAILSAAADAILLVSRVGDTRRHDLERTLEIFKTLEIPVLGAVINGVTREQMGSYGYGYGRPYGAQQGTSVSGAPGGGPDRVQLTGHHGSNGQHVFRNGTADTHP